MNKSFFNAILSDLKVELTDEFDRNFERKAFFDKRWPDTKLANRRGSLMMRSGALRNSLKSVIKGDSLHFSSSLPYASLMNDGGTITVTPKMKKFFWAMYYKSSGAVTYNVKKKAANNTAKNRALTIEAKQWKALALKKTGDKITIAPRPFIGHHNQVDIIIKQVIDDNMKEIGQLIKNNLIK